MHIRHLRCLVCLVVFVIATAFPTRSLTQGGSVDTALAEQYFREAQDLCERDRGRLWGLSLCGPMIFVDRRTRTVIANRADREGVLNGSGNVFTGKLPEKINIANTATDWAGVKWTMVMLPLPADKTARARLMAHELWHRVQDEIGFPASGAANNHLDSRDGRIWLQLEWRALAAALNGRGRKRRQAIADALLFRAFRRELFAQAAAEERAMEMHEGLAEYTGIKLSGRPDLGQYVVDSNLKEAPNKQSFVRSFAYASGPAYGILLDETGARWRRRLKKEDDLGDLLLNRLSIKLPANIKAAAEDRARLYDGDALRSAETERESARLKLLAQYRAKLVDSPLLSIPLRQMRMEFNPGNLVPLDTLGTVYPTIRVVDVWGILTVTKGALMNSTFTTIHVPAPQDTSARPVQGDGWTLELNPGWMLVPVESKGSYMLKKPE
jgi:hypothetical protein